jgi:FkbM family methyltransferase
MSQEEGLIRIETPNGTFWTRRNDFVNAQLVGMLKSFVDEGDVVLDVGAHIGTFAVPLARHVGAAGKVYAFEPVTSSFEILEKNISENDLDERAVVINALIGDRKGSYSASFSADHTSAAYFSADSDPDSNGRTTDGRAVPTIGLDEWFLDGEAPLQRLDVMKVDTEGMELCVLRSARRLIESFRPVIMAEMCQAHLSRSGDSLADVHRFLQQFGYKYFRNLGPRHAVDERFRVAKVWSPVYSSGLFDLMAVHPDDARYPVGAESGLPMFIRWLRNRVQATPAAVLRRLSSSSAKLVS